MLVVLVVMQTVQLSILRRVIASGSSTGTIDMTGWTENEKMNYEMHGVIPARVGGGSSSSGGGMVGGC